MNLYDELKAKQQEELNDFLSRYAFFAFSEKQFAEGIKKLGIDENEKGVLVSLGAGGFVLRSRADEFKAMMHRHSEQRAEAIRDPENGPQFALDMFLSELSNHEYSYTGDAGETLDALGYSLEDINADPVLLHAMAEAQEILDKQW